MPSHSPSSRNLGSSSNPPPVSKALIDWLEKQIGHYVWHRDHSIQDAAFHAGRRDTLAKLVGVYNQQLEKTDGG